MDCEQREITILPGTNRAGEREGFTQIVIRPGDTLSIVGSTGAGKSAFINDIEVLAQADTITGRRILIDGSIPSDEMARDPSKKPIALITQNTRVLTDLIVARFLDLHIQARRQTHIKDLCTNTIQLANEFTGEMLTASMRMTTLSGGQTRALLIADAILIGRTPILLLDEIENAGIFKERVIACIKECKKTVIFVTHDPYLALSTDRRIVMQNGAVANVLEPGEQEKRMIARVSGIDAFIQALRERIRAGEVISDDDLADEGVGVLA
ncbi:MAG: ATP-binding cassette domain-containing protein [Halobacteriota archaeon]